MRLDDNLPEDNYFIKESMNFVTTVYGGSSEDWILPIGVKEIDENGKYSFKQEFIRIMDETIDYVDYLWVQTESKKDFEKRISIDLVPIKNINSIMLNGFFEISIYSNSVNGKNFTWSFENSKTCFNILNKFKLYYESKKEKFSVADEIKKFKELLDDAAITEDEFNDIKNKLLR